MDVADMEWSALAVLLAAAEHRSLSRAAQALQISQSTASRRMARLEALLGAPLFDRTPKGLVLTHLGEALLPRARLIAGHINDIARLAAGSELRPQGRVRLALPDGLASVALMPRLCSFYARYPDVSVDLLVGPAVVDLVRREADIALRFVRPQQGDLLVQEVGRVPLATYVHPRLRETPAAALRWLMLADPPAAFLETRWIQAHVQPTRTMQCSAWNPLFVGVQSGLGAAILSPVVAEPAGLARLEVPGAPPLPSRPLYLVCHRALRHVPRIQALRGWLREACAEILRSGSRQVPQEEPL